MFSCLCLGLFSCSTNHTRWAHCLFVLGTMPRPYVGWRSAQISGSLQGLLHYFIIRMVFHVVIFICTTFNIDSKTQSAMTRLMTRSDEWWCHQCHKGDEKIFQPPNACQICCGEVGRPLVKRYNFTFGNMWWPNIHSNASYFNCLQTFSLSFWQGKQSRSSLLMENV